MSAPRSTCFGLVLVTRREIERAPRPTRAGFTLVEVVVGLAVGGIVLLAGFAALGTIQDRSEHALEASTRALQGATARATLVEWLATARLQSGAVGVRFEGLSAEEHALVWDELAFPTPAPTPVRAPITGVRLYIDTDPTTAERGLVAELTGRADEEPRRFELAPQAVGLRIRYLPPGDPGGEWVLSWAGQNRLPQGIELTLLDDPADPLPTLLRLPIRVPMASLE